MPRKLSGWSSVAPDQQRCWCWCCARRAPHANALGLVDTALLVPLLYTAPINLIACSALFLGDGLADPIGRLLGRCSNPYALNPKP
jgi:hypothetical protein